MKRLIVIVATALLAGAAPALAEEESADDEDVQFDEAVRQFGYTGGLAWQCSSDEAKVEVERQALSAYQGLVQLFGTDQAFFFAASYGAGSLVDFDKSDCATHTANFAEGMAKARKAD